MGEYYSQLLYYHEINVLDNIHFFSLISFDFQPVSCVQAVVVRFFPSVVHATVPFIPVIKKGIWFFCHHLRFRGAGKKFCCLLPALTMINFGATALRKGCEHDVLLP